MGALLADIGRHPLLSRVLALKGGTALNFLFGAPRRLSVDLDFNYVGNVERAEMLASGHRYQIQRAADAHAGRKFYLTSECRGLLLVPHEPADSVTMSKIPTEESPMKLATPIAILLGCSLIAAAIATVPTQGPQYQIVRLTEGRIARLDLRGGTIAYCSVKTNNSERFIQCGS